MLAVRIPIPIRRITPPLAGLHIPRRALRAPRRRPARHLPRIRDMHARKRTHERVVQILLRVLDEDLNAELRQAVIEEEGANGGHEMAVLHPRELCDGDQVGFWKRVVGSIMRTKRGNGRGGSDGTKSAQGNIIFNLIVIPIGPALWRYGYRYGGGGYVPSGQKPTGMVASLETMSLNAFDTSRS